MNPSRNRLKSAEKTARCVIALSLLWLATNQEVIAQNHRLQTNFENQTITTTIGPIGVWKFAGMSEFQFSDFLGADTVVNGGHGIAVDRRNRIWIGNFNTGQFLRVFRANGTQDPISPIRQVKVGPDSFVTNSCRGMTLDKDGSILWARSNRLFRLDPTTGKPVNQFIGTGFALLSPMVDKDGFIWTGLVVGINPISVLDPIAFTETQKITLQSPPGFGRGLAITADARTIITPDLDENGGPLYIWTTKNFINYAKTDSIFTNTDGELILKSQRQTLNWHPRDSTLWVSVDWTGSPSDNSKNGLYAFDFKKKEYKFLRMPEIGPNIGNGPRGVAFSVTGDTAYAITFNGNRVARFIRSRTTNQLPVVANAISNQTLTVGGASFTRDLNSAPPVFNDPDNDVLTYIASSSATNFATASISGSSLTIAPVAVGSATITVIANDNRGGAVSTSFTVTVASANRPPVVANTIPNQTVTVGGASFTRNLNASPAVFNDPDGDVLTYTAISSATNIATASISGSTLTVTSVAAGSATITVTANDGRGGTAPAAFIVTVMAANRPPMVANAISNQALTVGGASFTRNLNTSPAVFTDPDGDALTYTANSSATNIATTSLPGSTLTVAPVAVGSATITITANDGKGGVVSTTFGVTVNSSSGDQSAPQITHSGVTTAISGQSQPIAAVITDNVGVQSAMLFYRVGGAAAYDSAAMQNTGSNNYERAIPAGFVGERGVEYYFLAYDGAKNKSTFPTTNPQTNPQVIQIISGKLTFPRTTPAKAYRMISVPIELNDKSPSSYWQFWVGTTIRSGGCCVTVTARISNSAVPALPILNPQLDSG